MFLMSLGVVCLLYNKRCLRWCVRGGGYSVPDFGGRAVRGHADAVC